MQAHSIIRVCNKSKLHLSVFLCLASSAVCDSHINAFVRPSVAGTNDSIVLMCCLVIVYRGCTAAKYAFSDSSDGCIAIQYMLPWHSDISQIHLFDIGVHKVSTFLQSMPVTLAVFSLTTALLPLS